MKLVVNIIVGFFRFWYDFLIGDCWQIALGVTCVMGGLAFAIHAGLLTAILHSWVPLAAGAAIMLLIVFSVLIEFNAKARKR